MALPPIHRAAFKGDVEEVLRLIHQDPQMVHSFHLFWSTPLSCGCSNGHVSVVAALVDHGANIDYQGRGTTALYWACREGHVPVVELLMEKGADPTLADTGGWTPLMIASEWERVDVVSSLLQYPSVLSTTNSRDYLGFTALCIACSSGNNHEIVKMLLEARANPMERINDGRTAMDIAIQEDKQGCVILLKEWDRSYTITKARRLRDAFCRYHQGIAIAAVSTSSGTYDGGDGHANHKRWRMEAAIPTYLKGRVEGGQPLPKVEMMDSYEKESLVESVLEYVICGGLKGELFVELMEMLGKTGYREEEEEP